MLKVYVPPTVRPFQIEMKQGSSVHVFPNTVLSFSQKDWEEVCKQSPKLVASFIVLAKPTQPKIQKEKIKESVKLEVKDSSKENKIFGKKKKRD